MAHKVTVQAGQHNVELPNGGHYDAGDEVILTDEEFSRIPSSAFTDVLDDNGVVATDGDEVVTQAAHVAAPVALTAATVSTANAATQSGSYVQADAQTVAALANALKTALNAVIADNVALHTTVADLVAALEVAGGPVASS